MQKRNIVKRSLLLLAVSLLFSVSLEAQTMKNDNDLQKRVRELEDRAALKELVDTFSILSDRKDVRAQVQLFTANATVETYRKDVLAAKLTGRKEMEDAFGAFLKNFETVYHFNGQQTVTHQRRQGDGGLLLHGDPHRRRGRQEDEDLHRRLLPRRVRPRERPVADRQEEVGVRLGRQAGIRPVGIS